MPSRPTNPIVNGETTLPDEDSNLDSEARHLLDRNFRSLSLILLVIGLLLEKLRFEHDYDHEQEHDPQKA
jgi:hypothetical protein